MAVADDTAIGRLFRLEIIGKGPIDWRVVHDLEKWQASEAQYYPEGEEDEVDELDLVK
jgi:hypothetical protein